MIQTQKNQKNFHLISILGFGLYIIVLAFLQAKNSNGLSQVITHPFYNWFRYGVVPLIPLTVWIGVYVSWIYFGLYIIRLNRLVVWFDLSMIFMAVVSYLLYKLPKEPTIEILLALLLSFLFITITCLFICILFHLCYFLRLGKEKYDVFFMKSK
jgi:hypothetical protein